MLDVKFLGFNLSVKVCQLTSQSTCKLLHIHWHTIFNSRDQTYMNVSGHPKVGRIYDFVGTWIAALCQLPLKNTKARGLTLRLPWHVYRPINC